jgi:hypothetical protein
LRTTGTVRVPCSTAPTPAAPVASDPPNTLTLLRAPLGLDIPNSLLARAVRALPDPVGAGLCRQFGAATPCFVQFDYAISGEWLELLKEIAPSVTRVAVLRDPAITAGQGQIVALHERALWLS